MKIRDIARAAAIIASLTFCADVEAQSPEPDSVLVRILQQSAARQDRLRLAAPQMVEGHISEYAGGTVRFLTGDTIPASQIRQVEIGARGRSGAIPGALAGAVLLGPYISYFLLGSSRGSRVRIFDVHVGAIAAGGVIGGLVGAALKPAREGWETVWTSPSR